MTKQTVSRARAETLVRKMRLDFVAALESIGVVLKEGEFDLHGDLFSQERIARIYREVETGTWELLREYFDINAS